MVHLRVWLPKCSHWGKKKKGIILKHSGWQRLVSHSSPIVREIEFVTMNQWVLAVQWHSSNWRHGSATPDMATQFCLSFCEMGQGIAPNTLPLAGMSCLFLHSWNLGWFWSEEEMWAPGGQSGMDPMHRGTRWCRWWGFKRDHSFMLMGLQCEEMASGCTRGSLDWISERISPWRGQLDIGIVCPRKWWCCHPWRYLKDVWIWFLGTWFRIRLRV